jgi:hypothetical protein
MIQNKMKEFCYKKTTYKPCCKLRILLQGKQPINLILMEQAQPYNENWMLVVS